METFNQELDFITYNENGKAIEWHFYDIMELVHELCEDVPNLPSRHERVYDVVLGGISHKCDIFADVLELLGIY